MRHTLNPVSYEFKSRRLPPLQRVHRSLCGPLPRPLGFVRVAEELSDMRPDDARRDIREVRQRICDREMAERQVGY